MLTLSDLLNSAEEGRKKNAEACTVKLIDVFHTLEDKPIADEFKSLFSNKSTLMTYFVTFKFEVTSAGSKRPHKVFIQVNPDFDLKYWESNKAQISCDCEDFKFHSVYFAKQYDSLFETDRLRVTYSTALTQPPKTATTIVCKHCIAALNYLVQNYQSIMKNI